MKRNTTLNSKLTISKSQIASIRYWFQFLLIVQFSFAWQALHAQTPRAVLYSPDKQLCVNLAIRGEKLCYSVAYKGHPVIEPSLFGLHINHSDIFPTVLKKIVRKQTVNETYPLRGVHNQAVNHYNETLAYFSDSGNLIQIRVFNNGVAFRYQIVAADSSIVGGDRTTFSIPAKSVVWSQNDTISYEGKYEAKDIEDVKTGEAAGPPLTIKLPDNIGYAAITEGGVDNFAGMSLVAKGNKVYEARLNSVTKTKGNIFTPWRIIEVGKDLNTLVNCDIISNVSPKPDKLLFPNGFNTTWVKPGKSVWSWLAGNGGVTFENMKKYSKWAGELGIEYNLVDEGWSYWHDGNKSQWDLIKDLVDFSNQQNVKIWLWKAYPDRKNIPGLKDPKVLIEFLDRCKQVGVVGLKIDFFDGEGQEILAFYQTALREAAKRHLLIDFHGANKPTGQSATWPNEMTREGIRGLESGASRPEEMTAFPFTRLLAGHADYTPLTLNKGSANGTTLSFQVATLVTLTSPLMCLAVNPEKLLGSSVKKMVTEMPTVWDETIVLPESKIGELAIFARRKGSTWYLAMVNGNQAKTVKLPLLWLGKGQYRITELRDDPNSIQNALMNHKNYKRNNFISCTLQAGGGFVAKFEK
jgi:alpha-glucosidase